MKSKTVKTIGISLYIFWMIYATIDLRYDILSNVMPVFFSCFLIGSLVLLPIMFIVEKFLEADEKRTSGRGAYCLDELNNAVKAIAVCSVIMYITLFIAKLICGRTNRLYDYFLKVIAAILITPLFLMMRNIFTDLRSEKPYGRTKISFVFFLFGLILILLKYLFYFYGLMIPILFVESVNSTAIYATLEFAPIVPFILGIPVYLWEEAR
ncbi:MAG: hypothetical protein IJM14_08705 [Lachnospiraceae bacterium]|nr:hypothetical protein [Lachnospiraceae bacterium]